MTEAALMQRMNRVLAREGSRLYRCREDARAYLELGRYYMVNDRNCIEAKDVDLEAWARDLGALRPGEVLMSEPAGS